MEIGSVNGTEHTGFSESTFLFDDLIVDSKVYRRVLAQARSNSKVSLTEEKLESAEQGSEKSEGLVPEPAKGWDDSLSLFCSTVSNDTNFLQTKETADRDPDFRDELSAIRQWFHVLSVAERKSSLHDLAQDAMRDIDTRAYVEAQDE